MKRILLFFFLAALVSCQKTIFNENIDQNNQANEQLIKGGSYFWSNGPKIALSPDSSLYPVQLASNANISKVAKPLAIPKASRDFLAELIALSASRLCFKLDSYDISSSAVNLPISPISGIRPNILLSKNDGNLSMVLKCLIKYNQLIHNYL